MKRAYLGCLLLVCGCARQVGPALPPLTEVGSARSGSATVRAAGHQFRALYVMKKDRPGIAVESAPLDLIDAVAVLDADGSLYVADVLHDKVPSAYRQGKLDPQDILLASPHGEFLGAERYFAPQRDPGYHRQRLCCRCWGGNADSPPGLPPLV